jgi:dipeptidyl aminopeptidase/acylaminoacyl peptidase
MNKTNSMILDRSEITLNEAQNKMIISGWSKDVLNNTTSEKIDYLSDNLKVHGYIAYPNDHSKKYPCIIWNRGGYENNGVIDQFSARGMFGLIASWGYVVFASQYRGNSRSEGKDEIGGSDVNDILNIIPLADEFEFTDNKIWGIEGWSRGGMMTYLTLLKNPNFRCAVLVGAISDLNSYALENEKRASFYKKLIGEKDFEKKLEERTIINFADKLPNIPYLIMHGKSDETIPVEQSIKIAEKFKELKYDYRLKLFEDGDHYLKKHRKEVDTLRREWFKKYLD